jgi:hypothetical protein
MAAGHNWVQTLTFISNGESARSWGIVFYLFQCTQFFFIALTYPLAYRFARRLGFPKTTAVLLVTALLLLNTPLLRTLRHNQVNILVLDLFLIALLLADRFPLVSGLSAAVGIHLKLYPAVLFLPWLLTKRWRPLLAALLSLGLIVLMETSWGQNWQVWQQFLAASAEFPPGTQFRDNSLHSLVFNGLAIVTAPAGMRAATFRTIVAILVFVASAATAGWMAWRLYKRQRALAETPAGTLAGANQLYYGQAMDALALGLILAPRVWEHHYVLALPIILWGAAVCGRERPWAVGTAAFLMIGMPAFDIYPLSYHRLAGLLLMLFLVRPAPKGYNIGMDEEKQ